MLRYSLIAAALAGCLAMMGHGSTALAQLQCEPGYKLCPENLGGACAPVDSICCPGGRFSYTGRCPDSPQATPAAPSVPPRLAPPASSGSWYGAISVALWKTRSGRARVAVGIAWNYRTTAEARDNAIRQCRSRGGQGCRIATTFSNGGCGYVATGSSTRGVSYGTGATPAIALSECRKRGHRCNKPIGGCT
ncbi:MAG: DUF4189 domain-containing protein, partial [Hyphomicrobiaceae bacterium]|nr:DUF4189 domain-containing protein [Hyphomicrobiaceae bacterium]